MKGEMYCISRFVRHSLLLVSTSVPTDTSTEITYLYSSDWFSAGWIHFGMTLKTEILHAWKWKSCRNMVAMLSAARCEVHWRSEQIKCPRSFTCDLLSWSARRTHGDWHKKCFALIREREKLRQQLPPACCRRRAVGRSVGRYSGDVYSLLRVVNTQLYLRSQEQSDHTCTVAQTGHDSSFLSQGGCLRQSVLRTEIAKEAAHWCEKASTCQETRMRRWCDSLTRMWTPDHPFHAVLETWLAIVYGPSSSPCVSILCWVSQTSLTFQFYTTKQPTALSVWLYLSGAVSNLCVGTSLVVSAQISLGLWPFRTKPAPTILSHACTSEVQFPHQPPGRCNIFLNTDFRFIV